MPYNTNITIKNVVIWVVIVFLVIVIIYSYCCNMTEHMIDIPRIDDEIAPKWTRTDSCKFYMDTTTAKVLENSHMTITDNQRVADLIFPCGYNNIDDEIKSLPNVYYKDADNGS